MRLTISRGFHNLLPQGNNNEGGVRTRNMNTGDPFDLDQMAPKIIWKVWHVHCLSLHCLYVYPFY